MLMMSPRFSPNCDLCQVSGSDGEEMQEVPLSRSTKAVSLAAGLNSLQVEEDEPDGSAGQTSFLHSKCKIIIQKCKIMINKCKKQDVKIFQTWPTLPTTSLTCPMLEARRRKRRKKATRRRNPTESPGLLRSLSAWETPSATLTNDYQSRSCRYLNQQNITIKIFPIMDQLNLVILHVTILLSTQIPTL